MAAHQGSGQARRPDRRGVPAHRLRAEQPGQRRVHADRGPDPVQEPQPRPPHQPGLAAVAAPRQLRDPGAGPDAPGPALVLRVGRRHLSELQPAGRREARLRPRLRSRPPLPHGPAPDARPAHRERRRGDRGRGQGPDRGIQLLRDHRVRRRPDHQLRREAGPGQGPARRPRRAAWPRWATTSSPPLCSSTPWSRTPSARPAATTSAATSFPAWSSGARRRSTTSIATSSRGAPSRTTATGATSGPWTPTTTPRWTWSRWSRCSASTTWSGRSTPSTGRCHPPSSSSTRRAAAGSRWTRWWPRG